MGSCLEQNVNMTEKYRGHSIYAYCSSVNGTQSKYDRRD